MVPSLLSGRMSGLIRQTAFPECWEEMPPERTTRTLTFTRQPFHFKYFLLKFPYVLEGVIFKIISRLSHDYKSDVMEIFLT